MAEHTPALDGAPATEPASQQPEDAAPKQTAPDIDYYKSEAQKAFEARDDAKAAARAAAAKNDAIAKQLTDLQENAQNVPAEDLALLAEVKEKRAAEERKRALKEGDADTIAKNARKPLEEKVTTLEQDNKAVKAQLSKLLRDKGLKEAIKTSEFKPLDGDVVFDALQNRVTMANVGGTYVPEFLGADGQPLYDAEGKVTDHARFVSYYLGKHPNLCKAQTAPGSGAPAPGAGSTTPSTEGLLPKSITEWNAMSDEQKVEASEKMPTGYMSKLAFHQEKGGGMFD